MEEKITIEATIYDGKYHNSKTDDNNWVDLSLRVYGQAGIEGAMRLPRAKNKIVKLVFEQE